MNPPGYNVTQGEKAAPARKRFTDPGAVYACYDELKVQDDRDSKRRAKIRNAYDGGLPYSIEQLKAKGLSYMTNLSSNSLRGTIESRSDAILKLNTDQCDLVELVPVTDGTAGPDDERIAEIVASRFSAAIRKAGHTIPAIASANKEADLYGIGPVTWTNDEAYEPIALERGQLKFRNDGPASSSDHDLFMFESTLPASYLFMLLDNEKAAADSGWNVPALKRLVVEVFSQGRDIRNDASAIDGLSPVESAILRYRTSGFYEAHQFATFNVLHVYVREMQGDRGVTHIIVPGASSETKEFLFYRENAYTAMDNCLLWFAYTSTERFASAIRGLATYLVPVEKVSDRLTCAIIDSAFRSTRLVLQQDSPGNLPNVTLSEGGTSTVVAAGLTPVPNANAAANLQALAQIRGFVSQIGTGAVAGTDLAPISTGIKVQSGGEQMSKAEAEIRERQRMLKDEALFNARISFLDKVFSETFRRFMNKVNGPKPVRDEDPVVREFIQQCAKCGVTEEILKEVPDHFVVETCRDLVLGADGKYQLLAQTLQLTAGNLDEAGRKCVTHDMYRLKFGRKAADRYCPLESRDAAKTDAASFATQENNAIKRGEPVMTGIDQRHWSHIPVHAQVLQEIQQLVQQGLAEAQTLYSQGGDVQQDEDGNLAPRVEDPERIARVLEAVSAHIQEHLAIGRNQLGMKDAAKRVDEVLRGMDDTIHALNLAIATQRRVREAEEEKRQREMEALQQQASEAEMQKALAKVQADKEVGLAKVQADKEVGLARVQSERELNAGRLQNDREHRAGQLGIETESARARAANEAAVSRAGIENRRAESRASIETAQRAAQTQEQLAAARAASEMSNTVSSRMRRDNVTGRTVVPPSAIVNPEQEPAVPAAIPL